jgi:hypothetical protein
MNLGNDIIVFKCKDGFVVRHLSELPSSSIFHKSSAPLTDLNRPFPVPVECIVLQTCLVHALVDPSPSMLDIFFPHDIMDSAILVCDMLNFTSLHAVLVDKKQDISKKKGKKGKSKNIMSSSVPFNILLLDTLNPVWDPNDYSDNITPIRLIAPRTDGASVDTFYLPKPSFESPSSNVLDFFAKTSEFNGKFNVDSFIQSINKNLNLPSISKREVTALSDLLPKALASYKKFIPSFNPSNPYHMWSFWRDSFSGKWKDIAVALPQNDSDFHLRFFIDICYLDLSGWTAMSGKLKGCNAEDILVSILFKDAPMMKKAKQIIHNYILTLTPSAHHVHPTCDLGSNSKCFGCNIHLDFVETHTSYMNDLHNINPFFFSL